MVRTLFPASRFLALVVAGALPAGALAQAQNPDLNIDVATHTMPGMPGLGILGKISGAMGGEARYGMTRHPGMPGRYMDVALHNRRAPGTPATQTVPRDLRVGHSFELLPPPARKQSYTGTSHGSNGTTLADGDGYKVRYYWGCGDEVRRGQPAEYSMAVRGGQPVISGRAMPELKLPGETDPGPDHVLWPNQSARKLVSNRSSLVGPHELTGGGLTAPVRFSLAGEHDFLPDLDLDSKGGGNQPLDLSWNKVAGARAYFLHAIANDGNTVVMWSSSEDAYAGPQLLTYLPESLISKWTAKRTLLGPDARNCRIPAAVLAGGGAPIIQMIAYGKEHLIPGTGVNLRLRSKSTATLMGPGAGIGLPNANEPAKDRAKVLLRGLIGR